MSENICIFEDDRCENLLPIVYLRPVFELRCGINLLREKLERAYPGSKVHLVCRDYLADTVKEKTKAASVNDLRAIGEEDCLFLNGGLLAGNDLAEKIPLEGPEKIGLKEGVLVYARLRAATVKQISQDGGGDLTKAIVAIGKGKAGTREIEADLISYPWDPVRYNVEAIKEDYQALGGGKVEGFLDERVAIYGDRSQLYLGEGARVEAGVVLNLEEGPVYIGRGDRKRVV